MSATHSILLIAILFAFGLFQDYLSAVFLRCAQEKRVKTAAAISFLHTLIGCIAWLEISRAAGIGEEGLAGANLLAYCSGGALGTAFGLRKREST